MMASKLFFLVTTCALCLGYLMMMRYSENNLSTTRFLHLNFRNGSLAILNRVYQKIQGLLNNTRPVTKEKGKLKYTDFVDEHYENIAGTEVYVKTAIFDNRTGQAFRQVVKMWALSPMQKFNLFCLVNYGNNNVKVVKARMRVHQSSVIPTCRWQTAVIDCPLRSRIPPVAVSISKSKSRTNSWHKVLIRLFKPPITPKYGVCLSTIFDTTTRLQLHSLVEWLETQKLLGAQNVMLYGIHNVSDSVWKVLRHYMDSGYIIYHPLRLPFPSYGHKHLQENCQLKSVSRCISYFTQHLNYMDCIYRYADDFTYLAMIDTDDYVIPQRGYTWHDMLGNVTHSQNMASFLVQRDFFPVYKNYVESGQWTLFLKTRSILRKKQPVPVLRSRKDSEIHRDSYMYFKSIVRPSLINYFHVHKAQAVVRGWVPRGVVPLDIGRCYHYQLPSFMVLPNVTAGRYINPNVIVKDRTMFKYQKPLIKGMVNTLKKAIKKPELSPKIIDNFFKKEVKYYIEN